MTTKMPGYLRLLIFCVTCTGVAIVACGAVILYWVFLDRDRPYVETSPPVVYAEPGKPFQRNAAGHYMVRAGDTVIVERFYCLRRPVSVELQRVFEGVSELKSFLPEARVGRSERPRPHCGTIKSLLPVPIYLPPGCWTERVMADTAPNYFHHERYPLASLDFDVAPSRLEEELAAIRRHIERLP